MNIIKSGWSLVKNLRKYSIGIAPQVIQPDQGISPRINDAALVKKYRGWTYIAASRNGAAVASTPLRLYASVGVGEQMPRTRSGQKQYRVLSAAEKKTFITENYKQLSPRLRSAEKIVEIFDHPFLDMWNRPNPFKTNFEFMEETSIFSDITGDSYWQVTMDKVLGIPKELYLLPSQYVRIVPDKTKFIKGYLYGRDMMNKQAFKPEEILHFRAPNPDDPYYGLGCLEASLVAVNNYDAMDIYENALNQNKGIPGLLVSYKGRLKTTDIPKLEAEWNKTMRGLKNQGKTKVTSQEYEVKDLGFSPREMGFLQGRKWTRLEIADAFGVPISLLDTENVNKANAQAGNEQYGRFTINPRLRRIEDRINAQLIPMYNEPRLFAAFDNPVPEDQEFQNKQANESFKNNLIDQNEGRKMIGLPARAGGERLYVEITTPVNTTPQLTAGETEDVEETE